MQILQNLLILLMPINILGAQGREKFGFGSACRCSKAKHLVTYPPLLSYFKFIFYICFGKENPLELVTCENFHHCSYRCVISPTNRDLLKLVLDSIWLSCQTV